MKLSANLLLAQVILLVLGTLAIGTADPDRLPDQVFKALLAMLITLGLAQLRPKAFLKLATPVWLFSLALLALVLVIGHGTAESPGTKRWLFSGAAQFQPSEFAKLGLILVLSSFSLGAASTAN